MTAPPPRHHPYYENYQLVRNNRSAEYDYYDTHGEPMSTMTMHPQHQLPITPGTAHDDDAKPKNKKKLPRSYTEYNIFFQLERERILGELEKERRDGDDGEEKEGNAAAKDDDSKDSTPVVLNQPSDPNDILPRPPQFAQLVLSPKWYDSAHRIKENKLNKDKRKHRKTHGLVGFLDLTRQIAKAWGNADELTKRYCKKVADIQLKVYKERLTMIKMEESHPQHTMPVLHQPSMMRGPSPGDISSTRFSSSGRCHPDMMPPPSHQYQRPPPPGFKNPNPNCHWQPHQTRDVPFDPRAMKMNAPPRYPTMPPLSPSTEHRGEKDPLDELMHRRRMYGSKSAIIQSQSRRPNRSSQKKRKAVPPTHTNLNLVNINRNVSQILRSPTGEVGYSLKGSNSYLSPEDNSTANVASTAITPSPSRKNHESSSEHLPMKKRHKKVNNEAYDATLTPGSLESGMGDGEAPSSMFSSAFMSSPSEMIMTPHGEAALGQLMSSPLSTSSYRNALDQYINESPFPYIDFSPQDHSGSYQQPYQPPSIPPHLAVPGGLQCPQNALPPRFPASPFDRANATDDFSDSEALDLDEEKMQVMWRRLQATYAKKRKERMTASGHEIGGIDSPGGGGPTHSFASPVEKIETAGGGVTKM